MYPQVILNQVGMGDLGFMRFMQVSLVNVTGKMINVQGG
jgi:hypothetical protein